MSLSRFKELDSLRGIAILLVIWFHCRVIVTPTTLLQSVYYLLPDIGWAGVDLFFVLSGFFITRILLTTYQNPDYFRSFYARRALRIFPLYYSVLAITYLIGHSESSPAAFVPTSQLAEALYWIHLQNLVDILDLEHTTILMVFWSLAVEEQFYLVWPMLVMWAAKRNQMENLCIGVWAVTIVFRVWYMQTDLDGSHTITFARLDGLALGAWVATVFVREGNLESLRKPAEVMAGISAFAILILRAINGGFYGQDILVLYYGMPLLAVLFASLLILAATTKAGKFHRVLNNDYLCYMGRISFGMYVFHVGVILFIKWLDFMPSNFWITQAVFFPLVTLITAVLAAISFKYFESPIMQSRQRLSPATD